MVGDYDDRVEQIIRLAEDLFLEKRKVVTYSGAYPFTFRQLIRV